MDKQIPPGWKLEQENNFSVLTVPTELYTEHRIEEPNYSKIPVLPLYRPNDHPLIIPPCPPDPKVTTREVTEISLIAQDFAITEISPDKLLYHGLPSLGINPMVHHPTHLVLGKNPGCVSATLVPIWKAVGTYIGCLPPGGSSITIYKYLEADYRNEVCGNRPIETDLRSLLSSAHQQKKATIIDEVFNRAQKIIDEERYHIHVFVKDLEDMIFFEETK